MLRLLHTTAVIGTSYLLLGTTSAFSQLQHETRPFTVKDSIEMTTFSDPYTRSPDAEAKQAPDGSGFVIVTTRGHLDSNELESCLWFYRAADIRTFLSSKKSSAPAPRLLYRKNGVPVALQTNSYGSLITSVEWSQDSRYLLVLVEEAKADHHLVRIRIEDASAQDLTPNANGDIRAVSSSNGTVSFIESALPPPSTTTTAPEITRTGQSLLHILFPKEYVQSQFVGDQWQIHCRSTEAALSFCHGSGSPFPAAAALNYTPSLSPSGDQLVSASPVVEVPKSWASYRSAIHSYHFDRIPQTVDRTGKAYEWPWQYVLIDLRSGKTRRLFDAPAAWTAGYSGRILARWSPDGTKLLLTSTFLPIPEVGKHASDSINPCSIAIYDLKTDVVTCAKETPSPDHQTFLMDARFQGSGDRIVSKWRGANDIVEEVYQNDHADWQLIETRKPAVEARRIRLFLHQDLDIPPALWAESGGEKRLLWNPNPQLANVILAPATVYRWTDTSGYQWRGALLLPATSMPLSGYPLVIQTHGFHNEHEFMPDGSYTTGMAAQPLASSGIAVLQMDDRADKHTRPTSGEADDAVRGILAAIDSLSSTGRIDRERIGLIGFSRTHWYVERALEVAPERFRAATLIDGIDQSYVTDILFAVDSPIARADQEHANDGPPFGKGLEQWFISAPGFHLDKISTPVRLEAITPASLLGEWEIYSALRQQNKSVDLVEIPEGQHILQKPQERYASQQGNVDWFRFWLQGVARRDAEDQAQYQRWIGSRSMSK